MGRNVDESFDEFGHKVKSPEYTSGGPAQVHTFHVGQVVMLKSSPDMFVIAAISEPFNTGQVCTLYYHTAIVNSGDQPMGWIHDIPVAVLEPVPIEWLVGHKQLRTHQLEDAVKRYTA